MASAKLVAGAIVLGIVIVVLASIGISLWADSTAYGGIGVSIAQAIAQPIINFFQGLANILSYYLNPQHWLIMARIP